MHPPFTDLRSVQTLIDADDIPLALGAQHCHWEEKGAFTGEVAPAFLAKLNVRYVIAGHSERRELFGETDEMVALKTAAIQAPGHDADRLRRRDARGARGGRHRGEGRSARSTPRWPDAPPEQVAALVIAYEPIWAIGTGRTATAEDAQAVIGAIRRRVAALSGEAAAAAVRIQYGGSVKAANIVELMAQPDIDGALVGGASLDPDEFARIANFRRARRS